MFSVPGIVSTMAGGDSMTGEGGVPGLGLTHCFCVLSRSNKSPLLLEQVGLLCFMHLQVCLTYFSYGVALLKDQAGGGGA